MMYSINFSLLYFHFYLAIPGCHDYSKAGDGEYCNLPWMGPSVLGTKSQIPLKYSTEEK
ncbi:unnamed protein product, partial [Dicrocoelium dendriticum]